MAHTNPITVKASFPYNPSRRITRRLLLSAILTFSLLLSPTVVRAQITEVGGIARDFAVVNRATEGPIHLTDFAGQVIVLDFFAYWCGPCRESSPDLETNINDYYHGQNGNPQGVPVTVLPVNIEDGNEAATDLFIEEVGMDLVANDYAGEAYHQFATGFIPLFVVINGVADSPSHAQWEVLYRDSGYPGAPALRSLIDSVQDSDPAAPPSIRTQPEGGTVLAGTTASLQVQASGAAPLTFQWFKNDTAITGATQDTLVLTSAEPDDSGQYHVVITNEFGTTQSAVTQLEVRTPGDLHNIAYEGPPVPIPDATPSGVSSQLIVNQPELLLRLRVSVHITHTYIGDLHVLLRAPWGETVTLHEFEGSFSESLTISQREISEFVGRDPRGTWSLLVSDHAVEDAGTLESWNLELLAAAPVFTEDFTRWMEQFTALTAPDRAAGADPDLDGIPNLLEYALATAAPDTPDVAPKPTVSTTHPDHLELVINWRPGIDSSLFEVMLCEDLAAASWSVVTPRGNDVIVDSSDPAHTDIFLHRSLPQVFLQLRSKPDAP